MDQKSSPGTEQKMSKKLMKKNAKSVSHFSQKNSEFLSKIEKMLNFFGGEKHSVWTPGLSWKYMRKHAKHQFSTGVLHAFAYTSRIRIQFWVRDFGFLLNFFGKSQ